MRLWLLSLVAGITLGITGTPLGKVSKGREEAEEEKEAQDKPKKTKRDFFITGGYSGMTTDFRYPCQNELRPRTMEYISPMMRTSNATEVLTISLSCNGSCNESKMHHLNSSEKEKGEGKEHRESLGVLNLPRTILLQLLNQTKAMNRSSEMDFIHWNLNGNITRDLCEGCCKEKENENPDLGKQAMKTSKHTRRKPGQWTILGTQALPLGNNSINMVMMFHNGTHIGYPAKKVTQQAENLRGGWCSGCCKDDETLEALERREGEEVIEVPPTWT